MSDAGASKRQWLLQLLLVLAAGGLLGRLGPFGTFSELMSGERYAYWIGLTLLMWLQGVAMFALIAGLRWPHVTKVITAGVLAAVPTAFEVAWAEMLLRVERDLGPVDLLAIFGDVALLSVPLLLLTHALRMPTSPLATEAGPSVAPLEALLDLGKTGPLLAVGSEDHYLRLYSDKSDQLVAMRFADALATLAGENGMQVHRSWWVAADAVDAIRRAGDGLELTLRNGLKVPVSRSYAQQVRSAWADQLR